MQVRLQMIKRNGSTHYTVTIPKAIVEALPGLRKGQTMEIEILSVNPPAIKLTKVS